MSEDHNSHAYAVMFDQIGTVRWQLVHSKCYGNNEFLCILLQEEGTFVLVFEYFTRAKAPRNAWETGKNRSDR